MTILRSYPRTLYLLAAAGASLLVVQAVKAVVDVCPW